MPKIIEEDQEDKIRKKVRKLLEKQAKDGDKYLKFVVALPLIGAIALSVLGAINYEYDLQFDTTKFINFTYTHDGNCVVILGKSFCQCNPGWTGTY